MKKDINSYFFLFFISTFFIITNIWGQYTYYKINISDVKIAVDKGLRYLIEHQELNKRRPDFGSFYNKRNDPKFRIAITSFACLSLLANGNLPNRGRYEKNIKYGLQYILKSVNPNGYIARLNDDSRMHGHGFAVLFLAQIYGMCNKDTQNIIRDKLEKAVELILKSQTVDGGWGYLPTDKYHEGSITVCQLQALRSCRNIGIRVPKYYIDKAVKYLKRSANPDGSFKYRLGLDRAQHSFPLTAAGVSSLNATGEYESEEIKKGLEFMMKYLPGKRDYDPYYRTFYYYGHFYAIQAMYHAPSKYWRVWYPTVFKDLLKKQNKITGAWGDRGEGYSRFGPTYATAIATLILQVIYNYLPIFQK